jgi:glyoxylase-like metal-dependent hydrolase (beta-lactamase superfamily II)
MSWRTPLVGVLVLAGVAGALFLCSLAAAPMPAPPPFTGVLPPASPPAGMALYQLPAGVIHRTAAFAYRGGSFRDRRDFAMAGALVRHPRGDLLIDTGFGREIEQQIRLLPFLFRAISDYDVLVPAADQLDAAGYDRKSLRAVLLTHAHWDHVSGIADFPGVPVLVTAAERRFVADGGMVTVVARSLGDVPYEEYDFEGGPYLGFPRSHDVYGDGAIVVVPAPGHTPGSVIVFVVLPDGTRWAFLGDLVWQREGILEREERPWLWRRVVDRDPEAVRTNILRVAALAARFPEIVLVPAHDARGFDAMPRITRAVLAPSR